MTTEIKSVYKRGADDGFWAGLYMSVLFLAGALSIKSPLAGIVSLLMFVGVPFATYKLLRRAYRQDYGSTQFSALWLHGICLFFFGSLILALTVYVFLAYVDPGYIHDTMTLAIDVYSQADSEDIRQAADVLQAMIDKNMLPTPISVAVDMIWTVSFTGSMLSLLMSLLVRAIPLKKNP